MKARPKPYTRKLLIWDTVLTVLTSGLYLFYVGFRELWVRL